MPIYTYDCTEGHEFDLTVSFADSDKPQSCPRPKRPAGEAIRVSCCGSVIQSLHRHDWHPCECGNVFIDGGDSYRRMGAKEPFDVEEVDPKDWPSGVCGAKTKKQSIYESQAAFFNGQGFTRTSTNGGRR